MTAFRLPDGVTLLKDLPEHGLARGQRGAVVAVFTQPNEAYEVEFADGDGRTTAMVALLPGQIALVWHAAEPGGTSSVPLPDLQRRPAMPDDTETVENRDLIASDKVEGTAVFDRDSARLGTIHNFMVDKRSGQVAYAVLSFGGFLGLGESYHPLPWRMLTYDTGLGGYVVGLSRQELEATPRYPTSNVPDWSEGVIAS